MIVYGRAACFLRSRRCGAKAEKPGRFPARCPLVLTLKVGEASSFCIFSEPCKPRRFAYLVARASFESIKLMLMAFCPTFPRNTISGFNEQRNALINCHLVGTRLRPLIMTGLTNDQ